MVENAKILLPFVLDFHWKFYVENADNFASK